MAHSLKNQVHFAINQCWHERTQKYSYKLQNGNSSSYKVFSYSEMFRLKDVGRDFTNYLNREYPNIKQIKDITPQMIQGFLDEKTHCTKQSITTYYCSIKKINLILMKTYKSYENKFIDIVKPVPSLNKNTFSGRGVTNQIPSADYKKIIDYCKNNPSQSSYLVQLQRHLGLRINELTHGIKIKNVDFQKKEILLTNTKGGKTIIKQLTPESITLIKEIINKKYDPQGEKLFTLKNSSVNIYLSRIEEKLGILGRYSVHNLRARVAQDYYNQLRNEGFSKNESLLKTSLFLNHRSTRERMLTHSYINVD